MHILYVTIGYKPAYQLGGPIWSVSALAEHVQARGHQVTVFATNSNLTEDLDVPVDQPVLVNGVEVWYFRQHDPLKEYLSIFKSIKQSTGYMITPALAPTMRKLLPSIDVVHTQMPYIYPTRVAARIALSAGKPLFYSPRNAFSAVHLDRAKWKKRAYMALIEKPILRKAAGVIALTPDELQDIKRLDLKTPCYLVPNGIDAESFRRISRRDGLADLGIRPSDRVLLFMGRLHSGKGLDLLLDAYSQVLPAHPNSLLVIAGPDQDGLVETLRNKALAQSLSDRVIFPGTVTGERKLDLLARAELFVLPSQGEGISMAILEALASGTPTILSRECKMPLVAEWGAGAVLDRRAQAFAQAIGTYLDNPGKLAAASESAYRLARNLYGWEPIVANLESIYLEAVAAGGGGTHKTSDLPSDGR